LPAKSGRTLVEQENVMERIQSAIQKARIAREGKVPEAPARATDVSQPGPAPLPARDVAWATLDVYHPNAAHLERSRITTLEPSQMATPFDVMRTRLLKQMRANSWRRLAITSPGPGCGKTMTCLNLAFSLARQPDIRVMVIEVDLRRPSMAKTLGLKAPHAFAEVMAGKASASDNLVRYGMNLAFGTNHSSVRNSAELLQSGAIVEVLADLEKTYAPDLLIFDMPPMQTGDDAIAFLEKADCALLVAAAGATTVAQVDHCERDIAAHTNVMGVVLNKCRYLDKDQSYGYDYYS
jgi:Mrp family chromosome partitioning ATPase